MADRQRARLTALVPCGNEERVIRGCLESVRFADEVLVVLDAASTDRSREICEEVADRVLVHEYVDSATQKNWAIPQAAEPWVVVVDADERVTPELRERILEVLAEDGGGCDGYIIRRENLYYGKPVKHGGWHADYLLRLFRRDVGRYQQLRVHADVEVPGKVGRIEAPFLHDTHRGMRPYLTKFDRYTTWAAEDLFKQGRKPTWSQLFFRPWFRFLKMYVLRLGFLDGMRGLLIAGSAAMVVFTKYAKLWEMHYLRSKGRDALAETDVRGAEEGAPR
ncbi:MAG: glycosyltransferase family 2 protein [Planctomycetota bacterium]